MQRITLPVDIGFYDSPSRPLAAQECINYFPQNPQTKGALSTGALFFSPGITQVANMGSGPGRGFDLFDGDFYNVSGGFLYKMDAAFNVTSLGSISGDGRCSLANNGETIAIQVPGGDGYFYDKSNGLQIITDPTYQSYQAQEGGVQGVTVKDGYFVYTTKFEAFLSNLVTEDGGRGFQGLQFFTAEIKPDPNVLPVTVKNELHIIGTDTIERFQNTGGEGQPFQRIDNANIDKGIVGQFAFEEQDNSFAFLGGGIGEGVSVWRGGPGSASKISTAAIDFLINQSTLDVLGRSFAYSYSEDGNFFLGFTSDDWTIEFNSTSSALQGRPVWNRRTTNDGRWRVNDVADIFGKNIVTDNVDGRIGLMSRSYNTEYGETVKRQFSGAYMSDKGMPMFVGELEIRNETGVGGSQKLEMSIDGGFTWHNLGNKSLGDPSDSEKYLKRQYWNRLGRVPYQTVFRATVEDPVDSNVLEMIIHVERGNQ